MSKGRNEAVLQGVAFMGVHVLRQKRLILLHEERVWRTAKVKQNCAPSVPPLKHSMR